jgi:hypothetical protein
MAALVEAKRDGRLGDREASSVERHLAGCAECAAFAEDLARLGRLAKAPPAPVSEMDRRRGRVRLLQSAAAAPSQSSSRQRPGILVAVALVAIGGVASAKFTPWSSRADRPTVRDTPVLATGWSARVKGALLAGAVAIDESSPPAGGALSASRQSEPHGTDSNDAGGASTELAAVAAPSPLSAPSSAPSAPSASAASHRPNRSEHAVSPDVRDVSPAPKASGASAFDEAVGLVERGDYGAATERLEAFQRAHAKDPRAEDAAFLAIVALDHAGRRADAVRAARAYLAAYPNGFRRAEAEAISAAP